MFQIEVDVDDVVIAYQEIIAGLSHQLAMEKAKSAYLSRAIMAMENGQTIVSGPSTFADGSHETTVHAGPSETANDGSVMTGESQEQNGHGEYEHEHTH